MIINGLAGVGKVLKTAGKGAIRAGVAVKTGGVSEGVRYLANKKAAEDKARAAAAAAAQAQAAADASDLARRTAEAPECTFMQRIRVLFGAKDVGCRLPGVNRLADGPFGPYDNPLVNYSGNLNRPPSGRSPVHRRSTYGYYTDSLGELGIAPAIVAAGTAVLPTAGKIVGGVLGSVFGKKAPPPCTFGQKVSRIFGGRPNCR
jgi:hypothetical protein